MPGKMPPMPPGTEFFDASPLLAHGLEPFDVIQDHWASLPGGGRLMIHAPFLPKPLIAHFSALGIQALPHRSGPEDYWLLLGPKP